MAWLALLSGLQLELVHARVDDESMREVALLFAELGRAARMRLRRYSAVMNIAATTASAISPANVPRRYSLIVEAGVRRAAVPLRDRRDVAGPRSR